MKIKIEMKRKLVFSLESSTSSNLRISSDTYRNIRLTGRLSGIGINNPGTLVNNFHGRLRQTHRNKIVVQRRIIPVWIWHSVNVPIASVIGQNSSIRFKRIENTNACGVRKNSEVYIGFHPDTHSK